MTPDRIRENLADVNARIAELDTERELLVTIVHGWERLLRHLQGEPPIEQPQQGPVGREARDDGKTSLPAAVPTTEQPRQEEAPFEDPASGTPPASVPARRRSARSLLPAKDREALSPAKPKPIPAGTMRPCPDCDKSFDTGQGLSLHRRKAHDYQPWEPKPVGTAPPPPVIRKGAEWFVCARCPLQFPTRTARDRHQLTHPPIPTVEPVRAMGRGGG